MTAISDYATRIQTSWQKTVDGILETARLCSDANSKLKASQKRELLSKLPFEGPTFSKLAKIGAHSTLRQEPFRKLLPPNFTIMYEAALLTDEQLSGAIADGILSPEATRTDLERLRKGQTSGSAQPKQNKTFAFIQLPPDYGEDQTAALEAELEKMRQTFHVHVARPRTPEQKELDQSYSRLRAQIRKEADRLVHQVKQSRLTGKGKLTKAQKRKQWPFADHELKMEKDSSFDHIKGVLRRVGLEGEFERIQNLAFRIIAPPAISNFDDIAEGATITADFLRQWESKFAAAHPHMHPQ